MMDFNAYLRYDSATGKLFWRTRDGQRAFNTRFAGRETGNICRRRGGVPNMVTLCIEGVRHTAHRIIWEMHHGSIAEGMVIDHINGNPLDNRLENLRVVTNSQNLSNRTHTRKNPRHLKGVYPTPNGNFQAKIKVDYKSKYLGCFATKGLAAVAYAKGSLRYHGRFSPFARHVA